MHDPARLASLLPDGLIVATHHYTKLTEDLFYICTIIIIIINNNSSNSSRSNIVFVIVTGTGIEPLYRLQCPRATLSLLFHFLPPSHPLLCPLWLLVCMRAHTGAKLRCIQLVCECSHSDTLKSHFSHANLVLNLASIFAEKLSTLSLHCRLHSDASSCTVCAHLPCLLNTSARARLSFDHGGNKRPPSAPAGGWILCDFASSVDWKWVLHQSCQSVNPPVEPPSPPSPRDCAEVDPPKSKS